MKTRMHMALVAGTLAGLATAGCSTPGILHAYPGPEQDPAGLAKVVGTTQTTARAFSPNRQKISIVEVNDRGTIPWYSLSDHPTAVYVPPGRHKVDVRFEHIHGVANGSIWVDAHSNRTYQVKVLNPQARTERVYFILEDITAQTLVGGTEKASQQ